MHQQQYRVGAASKLLRAQQHSHKVAEPVRLSVKHKLDRCCRFQLRKGSLRIHPAQAAEACTPVNGSCHMAARHDKRTLTCARQWLRQLLQTRLQPL